MVLPTLVGDGRPQPSLSLLLPPFGLILITTHNGSAIPNVSNNGSFLEFEKPPLRLLWAEPS